MQEAIKEKIRASLKQFHERRGRKHPKLTDEQVRGSLAASLAAQTKNISDCKERSALDLRHQLAACDPSLPLSYLCLQPSECSDPLPGLLMGRQPRFPLVLLLPYLHDTIPLPGLFPDFTRLVWACRRRRGERRQLQSEQKRCV